MTQVGVTAFVNGLNTLTQGVDVTINYPTDFGDMGLIDWTLAGNYNYDLGVERGANSAGLRRLGCAALPAQYAVQFRAQRAAEKVALTANWTLDEFGITFRETYWGPQKNLTTPTGSPPFYPDGQAGVGLTDMEVRYNITEQLQFALRRQQHLQHPSGSGAVRAECVRSRRRLPGGRGPDRR